MALSTTITKDRIGKPHVHDLLPILLVAAGYYCGAKIGFSLTFDPLPIAVLWPPNAILLAGLLMTPPGIWWLILAAAFPAHLAVQLQSGIPTEMVLGWFAINCSEALIGAACFHGIVRRRPRFSSFRHVIVFLFSCAFLAPFASTFLDVTLVKIMGWGTGGFWQLWELRFFSNAVAMLMVVPALLSWNGNILLSMRKVSMLHRLEGGLLIFSLLSIGGVVFLSGFGPAGFVPLLLYAPLPVLLWAAVRFNPFFTNIAFLVYAFFAVWGTLRGHGRVVDGSDFANALALQLFLIGVSVPLLLLSAAIQERKKSQEPLRHEEWEELELKVAERTDELMHANGKLQREIEERKKAVEAERMSEARFAKVFRLSPDAMCIALSVDGCILEVNERWQILFGYRRSEAIGNTALQLNLYASERDFATVLEREKQWGFIRGLEVEMRDKEGCIRNTVLSGGKIDIGDESCFITIARDITEQRRAEAEAQKQREQLTHLTRVVVLGELSGALAHELNQPLAAILTNAQAARRFMARQPVDLQEIREILDDIVEEDKRAGEVIRRLRALFLKGEPNMQPLGVNDLVRETLELTHSNLIERRVPVILQLASSPQEVNGDWIQLQQVLLNLIVNACEAMSVRPPDTRQLKLATYTDMDGNVRIAVTDTGPGIDSDIIGKVFEAFFTTKENGMGFGLSISRAIIEEHGGYIEAGNNPGGGVTFEITLPASVSASSTMLMQSNSRSMAVNSISR